MDFNQIKYERINYNEYKEIYRDILSKMDRAESFDKYIDLLNKINNMRNRLETMKTLAQIKFSIDTTDDFYSAENDYWDELGPMFSDLDMDLYKNILDSSYVDQLETKYGRQYIDLIRCSVKSFSKDIIGLLQEENKLMSEYTQLLASASIDFEGKKRNLSDMSIFMSDNDRDIRKSAIRAHTKFFEDNEDKFDSIFDSLVKLRDSMAKKLGYKNFVELGYYRMSRTVYNSDMVAKLRQNVKNKYLPIIEDLNKEQAKRIGLDKITYYDEKLEFLDGNAKLVGDGEYIIEKGEDMYKNMSGETEEFYKFLIDNNLFDVAARENKAMGGYCTILPDYREPFIFGNFNGTVDDIDVLTHEAGHAFQMYMSRDIPVPELVFPTLDSCEIHSMSMEFLTYPWMEMFFGDDTEKYKKYHHDSAIKFLPYGCLVDHFQHLVYENPNMSVDERKSAWRELERDYLPGRDYEDLDLLNRGGYWFRQGHIYKDPFYYIDYVLAQLCALDFYELMNKDYKKAWEKYLSICSIGGKYSFIDMVNIAGISNPFN